MNIHTLWSLSPAHFLISSRKSDFKIQAISSFMLSPFSCRRNKTIQVEPQSPPFSGDVDQWRAVGFRDGARKMRFIPRAEAATHSISTHRPRLNLTVSFMTNLKSKRNKEAIARVTLGLRNLYPDRTLQQLGKNDSRIRTKEFSIWWRRRMKDPVFPIATQGTRQMELEELTICKGFNRS